MSDSYNARPLRLFRQLGRRRLPGRKTSVFRPPLSQGSTRFHRSSHSGSRLLMRLICSLSSHGRILPARGKRRSSNGYASDDRRFFDRCHLSRGDGDIVETRSRQPQTFGRSGVAHRDLTTLDLAWQGGCRRVTARCSRGSARHGNWPTAGLKPVRCCRAKTL